jgi:hypothetical protein
MVNLYNFDITNLVESLKFKFIKISQAYVFFSWQRR